MDDEAPRWLNWLTYLLLAVAGIGSLAGIWWLTRR